MTRRIRLYAAWAAIFFFLFFLVAPDDALCFDTDTLKTAGIVSGITLGVALIVVLIAGTVRDLKKDGGDEEEEDDVWSQSPVLRTLGYRPLHDSKLGAPPSARQGLPGEGFTGIREIEAFRVGRKEPVRTGASSPLSMQDPAGPRWDDPLPEPALRRPAAGRKAQVPSFSLLRSGKES